MPYKETSMNFFGRGGVKVRHFIVLPTLAMGAIMFVGRLVEGFLPPLDPEQAAFFSAVRTVLTTILMAGLIAWLAIEHRRRYQKAAEARSHALAQTRDFLSSVIDGSGEAIVTLDAQDRIVSWNPAAERIFGWTAEDALGEHCERMIPDSPRLRDERRRVGERIRSGEIVRDHETIRLRRDGTRVTTRITWAPLHDPAGDYRGAVAIVLDVTAECEMRRRLVEQERLAAVGELAAQVAHEVRNPLAGIRGACEVILGGKVSAHEIPGVRDEVLAQIDRLNRTVTDLVQFARPGISEPEPVDLNGLVQRVATDFSGDASCSGVEVISHLSPDLPVATVDPRKIERALIHLLKNAAQVLDHRGAVTLETVPAEGEVELRVADTGPGIAPELGDRVFEPFFTTRARGTGLGLAIVREIVRAHDGTIEAGRGHEGGAEFRIRLPAA
jgi:two-component system sensor histidine kinase HydH